MKTGSREFCVRIECGLSGFGLRGYRGKCQGITHCQIGQHLAINADFGNFHAMDQAAVGQAIQSCRGVNAGDPKVAQIAFSLAPVTIGIP